MIGRIYILGNQDALLLTKYRSFGSPGLYREEFSHYKSMEALDPQGEANLDKEHGWLGLCKRSLDIAIY